MNREIKQAEDYIKSNYYYNKFSASEKKMILNQMITALGKEFNKLSELDEDDEIFFNNVEEFIDVTIKDIYYSTK